MMNIRVVCDYYQKSYYVDILIYMFPIKQQAWM